MVRWTCESAIWQVQSRGIVTQRAVPEKYKIKSRSFQSWEMRYDSTTQPRVTPAHPSLAILALWTSLQFPLHHLVHVLFCQSPRSFRKAMLFLPRLGGLITALLALLGLSIIAIASFREGFKTMLVRRNGVKLEKRDGSTITFTIPWPAK